MSGESVQLGGGGWVQDITEQVAQLRYSTTETGGFRDCQIDLAWPLTTYAPWLIEFAQVRISDGEHGGVLWEGDLLDPGRSSGPSGPIWQLQGLGKAAAFKRVKRPYVGIHSSLNAWQRSSQGLPFSTINLVDTFSTGMSIEMAAPEGSTMTGFQTICQVFFPLLQLSQQNIGTLHTTVRAGHNDANQALRLIVDGATFASTTWNSGANIDLDWDAVTASEPADTTPALEWINTGVTFTAGASENASWGSVYVRPIIVNKTGTTVSANTYTKTSVTAAEIIGDLLGSDRTPGIDGSLATITPPASPHAYKHLAWPDGVTPEQILSDLMAIETGFNWQIWEGGRFYWQTRPTTARYEFDADLDDFRASGSTAQLFNAVNVRYRNEFGNLAIVRRTIAVPVLDGQNIVQEDTIDLGDNVTVTDTEAQIAGDNYLADHQYQTRGGTCVVGRKVRDLWTGREVHPREVRAGFIARVANVATSNASAVAEVPDGLSCFRIANTDYDGNAGTVAVELGTFAPTLERQVAQVATASPRRA